MPPLSIELSSRFRAQAHALPAERQDQVTQALAELSETIGQAHRHSGLGIRRLAGRYFEFRAGRDTRVVFTLAGSTATLRMVGSHDDVRRFLKNL